MPISMAIEIFVLYAPSTALGEPDVQVRVRATCARAPVNMTRGVVRMVARIKPMVRVLIVLLNVSNKLVINITHMRRVYD